MKAGFYQFAPLFGNKSANIRRVVSVAADAEMDLLILPEFFATGYQFISQQEVKGLAEPVPAGETTEELSLLSRKKNMYIVAGLAEMSGDLIFNSAVLTGPEGFIGVYRKTHLFFEETLYFAPGDTGFHVWNTDIGRIGIMICFDWFFPEAMRTLALKGAEVIAHPSNLVLPYCPDAMPVRCLENRVFAVTANRIGAESRKKGQNLTFIGKSEVVSPKGEIVVRAPEEQESLMVTEIDLEEARNKEITPFNDVFKDRRVEYYSAIIHKKTS